MNLSLPVAPIADRYHDDAYEPGSDPLPAVYQRDDGRGFERNGDLTKGSTSVPAVYVQGHELQWYDRHYGYGDRNDDHRVQQR